jgi:diguanylate cyclase (GGDEF)-like protein
MNYRFIIIFSSFLICLALAVVVNVIYGIGIVYTHLFYIPIILTGIWYPRYAGFFAAALGLIHIACDYMTVEALKFGSLLRAGMFMVVANVTSYLTLRRDRLLNSLRESDEALKQSHDELEQRVADRTEDLRRVNEELRKEIIDRRRMEKALKESESRYRDLSIIDYLTTLYNSRYFYHQLKMEIDRAERYGQPLTLLLLDIDDFKRFNDAYGHIAGDQVLLRLGHVVKRCLRLTDFAYRYGGEEFTILLPMTTVNDGAVTAERIRTEFKKESFSPTPGQDVHVTASLGLAQHKPKEDMKAFVHRVDQLMYQAKKGGKDRVYSEL